jgi:hypothetical protein
MQQSSDAAVIHHASARSRNEVSAIAANLLKCAPADLELRDGGVGRWGARRGGSISEVAQVAWPD